MNIQPEPLEPETSPELEEFPEPVGFPEPRHLPIMRAAASSRTELLSLQQQPVETIEGEVEGEVEEVPDAGAALVPLPERFIVNDIGSANWVVRRVMEARAYSQAIKEWADIEATRARREEEFLLQHFGAGLQQVLSEEMERARGRRKSLKLPAGTIGLRSEPLRLRVEDEDAALAWAKEHLPEAVRVTERVSRTALGEHLAQTGEVPDGCTLQEPTDRFYIR